MDSERIPRRTKPIVTNVRGQNLDFQLMTAVSTTDTFLMTRYDRKMGVATRAFVGFDRGSNVCP
jgi:hypothetical protein